MRDRLTGSGGCQWGIWPLSYLVVALSVTVGAGSCSRNPAGTASSGSTGDRQEELRVRRLVIVDGSGTDRAVLESTEEEGTRLVFWGKGDSIAASIGVESAGPRVTIGDAGGQPVAELGLGPWGGPVFVLRDGKGRRRAGLLVANTGEVGMGLSDEAGIDRCKLILDRDGTTRLTLCDSSESPRIRAVVRGDGACGLLLHDSKGARIILDLDAQGKATIELLDNERQIIWSQSTP